MCGHPYPRGPHLVNTDPPFVKGAGAYNPANLFIPAQQGSSTGP